jgi:hypothetical protein
MNLNFLAFILNYNKIHKPNYPLLVLRENTFSIFKF